MHEKLFGAANRRNLDKSFPSTVFRYPRYPTPTKAGIWVRGYLLRGQVVVFVNKPYPGFVLQPPFFPALPRSTTSKSWVSMLIPADVHPGRRQHPAPASRYPTLIPSSFRYLSLLAPQALRLCAQRLRLWCSTSTRPLGNPLAQNSVPSASIPVFVDNPRARRSCYHSDLESNLHSSIRPTTTNAFFSPQPPLP